MGSALSAAVVRLAVGLVAAVLLVPGAVLGQQDANVERGFAPEKLYEYGGIEHVNEFSGNLLLTIPIGSSYPINGGLSYSLTLVYNAKLWDLYSGQVVPNGEPVAFAELNPEDNAGIGWRLTLGQLLYTSDPGNASGLSYAGPDGGEHSFTHVNLHANEPTATNTWYTRDGSYLRLEKISGTVYEVESGDGTIRKFTRATATGSPPFRLAEIRDRFGNALTVTPLVNPVRWELKDDHRTHYVYFKTEAGRQVVDKVELKGFGHTAVDPVIATYTFGYTTAVIAEHCGDMHGGTPAQRTVPLLTSVSLPADGGSYLMDGVGDYYTSCSDGSTTIKDLPGVLHRLRLPTRGIMEWTYQQHSYPTRGIFVPQEPTLESTETLGVKTKKLFEANGTSLIGEWTYTAGQTGSHPSTYERWVRVTYPTGDETVFHFSVVAQLATGSWTGWEYGLPFKKSASHGTGGYFLSQEIYDGPAAGGTKKRSVYVGYEHDVLPGATNAPQNWYNSNRRVIREKAVYHDDGNREASVVYSEFDGLGHYRKRVLGGTFDAGNVRTETTDFNPDQGIYFVNQSTNQQSTGYTPWPSTSPWVLGTSTSRQVTEGSQTSREELCFEAATGYLLRRRVLETGTTQGTTDLVSVFTRDGAGNTTREQRYGSDFGSVGAGALCSIALGSEQYRIDHTYQSGVLAISEYKLTSGTTVGFRSLDRTIDASTGLPSSARDPALVATTFGYDGLGRLTSSQTGSDATTTYTYLKAVGTGNAVVKVRRIENGGSTVLAEESVVFDHLGRPITEKRMLASGAFSKRRTFYNAMGWVTDVAEWEPDGLNHTAFTKYRDFDPFGRAQRIEPPDGAAHQVDLVYSGVRVVDRTMRVATGASGAETTVVTKERYDRQGRLHQVVEPSGTAGTDVTTTYGYDEAGRLASVSQGSSQTRSFNYDNRGLLTQECHPEKGVSGNGCVAYSSYNAWGQPGHTTDGPNDLRLLYDRAGRPTAIEEWSGTQRSLKVWAYGTGTGAADRSRSKVKTADRFNYVLLGTTPYTVQVRETYTYGGRSGRVSARTTDSTINPTGGPPSDSFVQSFVWNHLGDPESLSYPQRTGITPVPRTVSFGYSNGILTSVPGYASSITYHPNGMPHQVVHTNNVTDVWAQDPNKMQRPASIEAWYLYGTGSQSARFLSGSYGYDGSGNVETIGNAYFVYDKVSRLVDSRIYSGSTGGGTQLAQSYTYDTYGNMGSIVTNGVTRNTPTSASTNRLTSGSYDAAGNLTGHNGALYDYGPFNEMWRYRNGGQEALYLYTADDERLFEFNVTPGNDTNRWTLRDLGGKVLREYKYDRVSLTWTVEKDYIYRAGTLLAAETTAGVRHFSVDHLGTPRTITNAAGTQAAYHVYYPFGEEASAFNQDTERMKFTGHERDLHSLTGAADDLDYMHARFCSPLTGRFLGVDPITGRPKLPQSWNRYSYAIDNPLKYVDPTGEYLSLSGTERAKQKAVKIANSGLFGQALEIDSSGNARLVDTGVQGPPTPEQAAMAEVLSEAIDETSGTVEISLVEGDSQILVGSTQRKAIDVTDASAIGDGAGTNSAAVFAHEVKEQFEYQIRGAAPVDAHAKGTEAEESVSGYDIVSIVPSNTGSAYVIKFDYRRGAANVSMTLIVVGGNVADIRRTP